MSESGKLLRWAGASFEPQTTPASDLRQVTGSSATNVWAVSYTALIRYDGATYLDLTKEKDAPPGGSRVFVVSEREAWVVGGKLHHWAPRAP